MVFLGVTGGRGMVPRLSDARLGRRRCGNAGASRWLISPGPNGPWSTAAWAVESDGEATVLDVRSSGPGISALQGMFRLG